MSLVPNFADKVAGAGNGKGLEASENKQPAVVAKQGLSGPNNSSKVSALPAFPPMTFSGQK